ncbi:DUF72 domain-containing protein [Rheinheimera sp.]|jgi:uncharacterized protein YecE (DUF72 family)|uniref:DUF72 domain-containing protein n=1 Tax=Rheinheimera sp. TaxID=1869214 RepID=UPI00261DCAB7|nr:DUF72 domain-containing protein [Rheinheimera sp.]MCA1928504.1 DUF72 domain-containing protein [Rheinheimera sp.]
MLYLGCPVWANPQWKNLIYNSKLEPSEFLANYSRYFNSVEGNTSFYADPSPQTVQRWAEQSSDNFRFTLKVPKRLSHQFKQFQIEELQRWMDLIVPLANKIALVHLQLPAVFSPQDLSWLQQMLNTLCSSFSVAVEVRHPIFFDKAEHEITLNRLLRHFDTERVIFDSRALFSVQPTTAALQDAQRKKPYLPVHAVGLTKTPMLRFVGTDDMAINQQYYRPWLAKVRQWLDEGKTPFCFFHSPDNFTAPVLARQFVIDLGIDHPILAPWPQDQTQLSLL